MNRLGDQTSPYLRQHAADPVDWYPWGDEALASAKELNRPLFLSIGYSSCHWCHVMGHESFADPATAEVMNRHFVSVKVDREERPDVDAVYMEAVQAATGRGGWPMSVFATPDGLPFLAGTYFPDRPRHGMPSFRQVLESVIEAWDSRPEDLVEHARALAGAVAHRLEPPAQPITLEQAPRRADELSARAAERLRSIFDPHDGGFGSAPKFPQPLLLDFLLRAHVNQGVPMALEIVERTLGAMASGGIYDHLGGGFARYSVDQHWDVPHFEKMLYDQALIARVYLHAWQVTRDPRWLQVLDETLSYVLRDLRDPLGGLYSAEDADSEGEEGRYYVWTPEEITDVLGPTLAVEAAAWYGVTREGNFEGRTILHRARRGDLLRPASVEAARSKLLAARAIRVRPGLDDKVITEWNAMMCSTLVEAAGVTARDDWSAAAAQIATFLLEHLRRPDGRVLRSWCRGRAGLLGYAADYAWLLDCCTRLGELSGDVVWTEEAMTLARQLLALFEDDARGGLYTTGNDAPPLVVRPRDLYDGVTPAAGSVAAVALARLGALAGDGEFARAAGRIVDAVGGALATAPSAFPELLAAVALLEDGPIEIVIAGDRADLLHAARRRFLPGAVLAWRSTESLESAAVGGGLSRFESPLFEGRRDGFAYVCRRGACLAPVDSVDDLLAALDVAVGSS
ncbi:MAG TPA: thioredoxin domain-containing protein [Acidimicrobiales bacterium]|nr:thioredoxin domain-containing protein [Acidimicrobiales bacterium]